MAEISSLMISLILASAVAIGLSGFYGEVATQYNLTEEVPAMKNMSYWNVTESVRNKTSEMAAKLNSTAREDPNLFWPFALLVGGWDALQLGVGSINIFTDLIADVNTSLGLPLWFTTAMTAIIVIIIVFALLAALFLRKV